MAIRLNLGSLSNKITLASLFGSLPAVSGGVLTSDSTYYYRTFNNTGTFSVIGGSLKADILVVAGGGGGAGTGNGANQAYPGGNGGGAGGLRSTFTATGGGGSLESPLNLSSNTAYTVTVGAGGVGTIGAINTSTNGSNSVFSTITSIGGGGAINYVGQNGGSGAGSNPNGSGGLGTTNQGFNGGSNSGDTSGGGGGAGAVGGSGSGNNGGSGGTGVYVSISGSSVAYAGGGGGGAYGYAGGTGGTGGTGGGGAGGTGNSDGGAATVNTGGGGGGATQTGTNQTTGGNGGSGIVVIRYPIKSALSSDSSLTYITINGTQYSISDLAGINNTIQVPYGTTSASISVTKSNQKSKVVISGTTGFSTGNNTVNIVVTAQDKITATTYALTFNVIQASTNSTLSSVTIDGTTYSLSDLAAINNTVQISGARTSIDVSAIPNNQYATVTSINGNTDILSRNQNLTILVTAQDSSTTTYNYALYIPSNPLPVFAGGILSSDSTYYYRTFPGTLNFTATGTINADILSIGGGGASGGYGGGGGAGAVILDSSVTINSGTHAVIIGAGGTQSGYYNVPSSGNDTLILYSLSIHAGGGGNGGGENYNGSYPPSDATNGGSGGGANWESSPFGIAYPDAQSRIGHNGSYGSQSNYYLQARTGGGGGGAGGDATTGDSYTGGGGGIGASYPTWLSAISSSMSSRAGWNNATSNGVIAGGGGGCASFRSNGVGGGAGGDGGGGAGSGAAPGAQPGVANTGSGGGGNGYDSIGLNGGSGLVIIRYTKTQVDG
jgi:hypothetical protein